MKLLSIQIFPRGYQGWESDKLEFGEHITQFRGPNGCGKTPIVQSIAYCLGYPCEFRNDIYEKCDYVILHIDTKKGRLALKRFYESQSFHVEVASPNNKIESFFKEKEYSGFLFEWLDFSVSKLVSKDKSPTKPYIATLLPIYYLDQDTGYSDFYKPKTNFIKDQFSEMMRLALSLPAKNSFDAKKSKIEAEQRLSFSQETVKFCSSELQTAKENLQKIKKTPKQLNDEIDHLTEEVTELKNTAILNNESVNAFDTLIASYRSTIQEINKSISQIKKRVDGVSQITQDIEAEIETLNLNEKPRQIFLSIDEICSSPNCKIFSYSSEVYSKNLLYLKDQLKDLKRNSKLDELELKELEKQREDIESEVRSTKEKKAVALEDAGLSSLLEAISSLMDQIFSLQIQYKEFDRVEKLEKKYAQALIDREEISKEVESYSSSKNILPEVSMLRARLKQYLIEWLDRLDTPNISRDITFENDFIPILGDEKIKQVKGSTRVRVILAYHAATIEVIAREIVCSGFRFLILDTPKQHELNNDALDSYFKSLKKLCLEFDIQVIFSTTEYHYTGDKLDKEWNPCYPNENQNMFLVNRASIE